MNSFLKTPAFLLCVSITSCQEKPSFRVRFEAVDDLGQPVPAAEITTGIYHHREPGEAFGKRVNTIEKHQADASGVLNFEGQMPDGKVGYGAAKQGYYATKPSEHKFAEKKEGRWEPWNHTVNITLKRIVNPIPLAAKIVSPSAGRYTSLPADKASYDLEAGDWTSPHGAGRTADLIFEMQGKTTDGYAAYSTVLTMSFSNPEDGLVFVERPKDRGSVMVMPYQAPEGGYASEKVWRKSRTKGQTTTLPYTDDKVSDDTKPNEDYFLRLRTKLNEKGQIVSAHYAKVQCGFLWGVEGSIKFQYHFNPKPNDRNLEFDPKRNLLKVEKWQQVTDP